MGEGREMRERVHWKGLGNKRKEDCFRGINPGDHIIIIYLDLVVRTEILVSIRKP